jgi:hypothetical protein
MLILKHLKTLQYVSIILLIIFRELVSSLLKSLNLTFLKFKMIKIDSGDAAASPLSIFIINYIIYIYTSRSFLLRLRIVSHKICWENLNTYSVCLTSVESWCEL